MRLLGLKLDSCDFESITKAIRTAIGSRQKITIDYANANTLRRIKSDSCYLNALNSSTITHTDGIGIVIASKILNTQSVLKTFNWTDHAMEFLRICEAEGWSIFFLGSTQKVILLAVAKIKTEFPKIKIAGVLNGYEDVETKECISKVSKSKPDIVWVGMGSPKQETWVYENNSSIDCYVVQSVGDLFSYLAGVRWRGPLWLRKLGLEWLVRFVQHPLKYFDRYILGIPVLLAIIIHEKYLHMKNEKHI